jgi:hypothetical protein
MAQWTGSRRRATTFANNGAYSHGTHSAIFAG